MMPSSKQQPSDTSRLAKVFTVIDEKIAMVAAAIVIVLTTAFIAIRIVGALVLPETERGPWPTFFEALIPNLIATFLLFVGSYVFLRELNRERKGADDLALAAAIASEVLKDVPRQVASEVIAEMRDLRPTFGVPRHATNRDTGFHEFLGDAREIWMAGKTLQTVLANHENLILSKLNDNTTFRFLVPDPGDYELMTVLSRTSRMEQSEFASALKRSIEKLEQLQIKSGHGSVEIRLMNFVPYNGYTIVDPMDSSRARTFVEFFGVGIDIRERISTTIPIRHDPQLYAYHLASVARFCLGTK